jgi:hypothetical protein
MYKNPTSSERTYTLEEAAHVLGRSINSVESLIRNQVLGFEVGQFGPVITKENLANFYLGRKPIREPQYKPEKLKPKKSKYFVKAKTRR